ncbi:hypothetical protein HNS01_18575 (plasmid) [Clostridium butyricum]|uniref:hypothetical protein n=2 Tax=Clostridium butyricum TaxID=1492 RepID=UPI0021038B82|nr:hypothetical protein [Clostridium butyricum]MCQ2019424.1 hypothetical protein [Clostridium butyricum]UTY55119.1 hypothetical protein HNS01_18575 [Clostridium butyricum]
MKEIKCRLAMYPTVSLDNEEIVDEFLNLLEKDDELVPEKWGRNERTSIKYKHEELKKNVLDERYIKKYLFLSRKKNNSYLGWTSIENSKVSYLNFTFIYPENKLQFFFDFADDMVELLNPRFCTASIDSEPIILNTEAEKKMYSQMKESKESLSATFFSHGPIGLSLRTYCSKHMIEYFGKEKFLNAPMYVKQMKNGGVRLDLVEKPWDTDEKIIFEKWVKDMEYFKDVELFGTVVRYFGEDYIIDSGLCVKPSAKWRPFFKTLW